MRTLVGGAKLSDEVSMGGHFLADYRTLSIVVSTYQFFVFQISHCFWNPILRVPTTNVRRPKTCVMNWEDSESKH